MMGMAPTPEEILVGIIALAVGIPLMVFIIPIISKFVKLIGQIMLLWDRKLDEWYKRVFSFLEE